MGNAIDSSMSLKRIKKELRDMIANPSEMERAEPWGDEELYKWVGTIFGPKGSPYENGLFYVSIILPQNYPFRPPKVQFTTKVFHPNVNAKGQLSLDILGTNWSPALTISKILYSLSVLLENPDPDCPLVPEIAKLFKVDRCKYNQTAKEWTSKYAN